MFSKCIAPSGSDQANSNKQNTNPRLKAPNERCKMLSEFWGRTTFRRGGKIYMKGHMPVLSHGRIFFLTVPYWTQGFTCMQGMYPNHWATFPALLEEKQIRKAKSSGEGKCLSVWLLWEVNVCEEQKLKQAGKTNHNVKLLPKKEKENSPQTSRPFWEGFDQTNVMSSNENNLSEASGSPTWLKVAQRKLNRHKEVMVNPKGSNWTISHVSSKGSEQHIFTVFTLR